MTVFQIYFGLTGASKIIPHDKLIQKKSNVYTAQYTLLICK